MVHPTKTDSELMTKQKERFLFLHTQYSQSFPQLLETDSKLDEKNEEGRVCGEKTPNNITVLH